MRKDRRIIVDKYIACSSSNETWFLQLPNSNKNDSHTEKDVMLYTCLHSAYLINGVTTDQTPFPWQTTGTTITVQGYGSASTGAVLVDATPGSPGLGKVVVETEPSKFEYAQPEIIGVCNMSCVPRVTALHQKA